MKRTDQGHWLDYLIGSDMHGHFVDTKAWGVFLRVAKEGNFDQIILNGDVADFSQISKHDKNIGGYTREFQDEVKLVEEIHFIQTQLLAPLRKAAGKTPITMRLGNHETRWLKMAESNGTGLAELLKTMKKLNSLHLEEVLALDKFGIRLSYRAIDTLHGTFNVIHGVKSSQGVAKANLLKYGSGTSGHSHRANSFTQVMGGKLQGWWESGCLRTKEEVEYLPLGDKPDWAHCFLTLKINRDTGDFFCTPHMIINGKTAFRGHIVSA